MEYLRARLIRELVRYFGDDNRRIEHALRVLHHADGMVETGEACDRDVVIAAALLHDIGIRISEERLGYNNGKTQEEFGPPEAEKLLRTIDFPADRIEAVKEIIGCHHTPTSDPSPELSILMRADQIVNRDERI